MRLFYIFSGVSLMALLLFLGFSKRPLVEPERTFSGEGQEADAALSEISFVRMRNGLKDWELTASQADFFEKDQTAFLKTVLVRVPTGEEDFLTLRGAQGRMDVEGKTFSLTGAPVSVQWSPGYAIETASLAWSSDTNALYTDDSVMISGEGIAVSGTGMWVAPDRSEVILKNVHAEIR